jgi:hypothetical protein
MGSVMARREMTAWGDGWVPGRANEPYQKKQVIDRLLELWLANPNLRLGQLIRNCFNDDLFCVEDWPMIEWLEEVYGRKDDSKADGQGAVGDPHSGNGVHGSPKEPA